MDKTHRTDRRTRYTRQAIKEILLEELKTKPYSKITVTEICKKAEMNRGTFYLHYYDIDDVLNDILEDFLSDTSGVLDHILCPYKQTCTYPFCEKIRSSSHYQVLFFDDVTSCLLYTSYSARPLLFPHSGHTHNFHSHLSRSRTDPDCPAPDSPSAPPAFSASLLLSTAHTPRNHTSLRL